MPQDVSRLVADYVPLGTGKRDAMSILEKQGFAVREERRAVPGCTDCDASAIAAAYTRKAAIPFMPYRSFISILLGCKDGRVVYLAASYVGNPF